jgi:putative transposase
MLYRRLPRLDLPGRMYFLGCNLEQRRRYFAERSQLAELLIQLYVAERDRGGIALHAYVVMPDHYRVLLTLEQATSVSAVVRKAHSLFAPECRQLFGPHPRIWQRRFYDHVIRDDKDLHDKWSYIHYNPVKAGLVTDQTQYPWSSCAYWETGSGPVVCDPPR